MCNGKIIESMLKYTFITLAAGRWIWKNKLLFSASWLVPPVGFLTKFAGEVVGGGAISCPEGKTDDGFGECKPTAKIGGKRENKISPVGGLTKAQYLLYLQGNWYAVSD